MSQGKLSTLLLVEDSEEDEILFRHALSELKDKRVQVFCVKDALDAIRCLKGEGHYADRSKFPFPEMVITDLKMPRADGFELLRWLSEHRDCAIIPTIVWSSSFIEADVIKAYELGAHAFVSKPHTMRELIRALVVTIQFWDICQRPVATPDFKCV